MRITRLAAYRVELPLVEGSYQWAGGKSVAVFDSTVVRVDTDEGLVGHGEVCPLGPAYLAAYANGVRAGLAELGPHLIGEDPLQLAKLNRRMDAVLKGHPYVKSAVDMACWDLLGKATGQPACVLMGGRFGDDVTLYRAISQESPEQMAAKVTGYRAAGTPGSSSRSAATRTWTSSASRPSRRCSSLATGWWPTPTPAGGRTTPCASSGPFAMLTSTSNNHVSHTKSV